MHSLIIQSHTSKCNLKKEVLLWQRITIWKMVYLKIVIQTWILRTQVKTVSVTALKMQQLRMHPKKTHLKTADSF